ncbi:uncharacterized protein DUF4243 [Asanoa ferruginea]|uniref:Uncharacterized protein DUF4243 n=1 Tax=Asanoa ferruginea TaxID=53367 RepID=A0A3D9ZLP3_9ACTN|nr:questin oxidase family protein [Asanoa ferruginea]REF96853.1 uncharacterized protein DUF4243 [Asanoa ferruginea]
MTGGVLNEAYQRFHRTGPEWGEDQLTNHGPMAVEVMIRRGYADQVDGWVDRYTRRLDPLPPPSDRITDDTWAEALGAGRRLGDWTAYFTDRVAEEPWRDVLARWWPRLLPGIAAGTTHGVIRVGHVVRALLAGAENEQSLAELAHGLAFWATRYQPVPGADPAVTGPPAASAGAAFDALPRIPHQRGRVADRFGQLSRMDGWPRAVATLDATTDPERALTDLVTAATLSYLRHGHASPVLLVHTATAPNAVLHTLPALPRELWAPSAAAVWAASAAIHAGWAPADAAPRAILPTPPGGPDAVAEAVDQAIAHGDEHVIKFTDTAVEVYCRTGHLDALAAASRSAALITP